MSGVILPADRNRLQRNRFLPAGDELATYFAEAELCVEAGGRWIRRVEVELTSDYRDRRRLGVREGCSIQLRSKALAFGSVGNHNPVDVQKLAIPLPEPLVVDAVVGRGFPESEQKGHVRAFAFNHPMGCSLFRQGFESCLSERTQKAL